MIVIKKSLTADTRTAKEPVTKVQLLASSIQHIGDVRKAIDWMCARLQACAAKHDWTKIKHIQQFHEDFKQAQENPDTNFTKLPWYSLHVNTERHHLNERCPDDVDLFDVLERVADITMAGMGRSGKVTKDDISPELLLKAYHNTVERLAGKILVKDE